MPAQPRKTSIRDSLRPLFRQKLVFLAVGVVVYGVDLGVYSALLALAPGLYVLWNVMAKIAGAAVGFALHDRFTFAGEKASSPARRMVRYACLLAFNVVAAAILLFCLVELLGLAKLPSKIAVDVLVIVSSFLFSKFVVFR